MSPKKHSPSQDSHSPQNPYKSWLVSASAGSGKTYQLSRRFLHLVASGAHPGSILTVTFTIKAAAEMRARILEDAAKLMSDEAFADEFSSNASLFFRRDGLMVPPPLSPKQTGERILKASQSLKITTIDAIFLEWVSRFPFEAGADPTGQQTIAAPFSLANRLDEDQYRHMAWKALCRYISGTLDQEEVDEQTGINFRSYLTQERISGIKRLVHELKQMDTYLWHEDMVSGSAFLASDPDEAGEALDPEDERALEAALINDLREPVSSILAVLPNRPKADTIASALLAGSLEALQESSFLTKQFAVSGQTVSKALRNKLSGETEIIDEKIQKYLDRKKVRALNERGAFSYQLFQLYRFFYNQLRFAKNHAEFSDLVKGSYALFKGEGSEGVKFLLSRTIHHLMLDEFQDTSVLQWSVFKEIADHLLSGEWLDLPPGPQPSLFVVGDEKQSIYGFREADPEVMGFVAQAYPDRLETAPLSKSFRTAPQLLEFVNEVFSPLIAEFPLHETATTPSGSLFIPDQGQVFVLKDLPKKKSKKKAATLPDDSDRDNEQAEETNSEREASPSAEEAEAIAAFLAHALSNPNEFPVYQKGSKSWRPLEPGDCAVLYRSGTHTDKIEQAIRRKNLACQREEEKGYFTRPEIADTVALLQFLAVPGDLVALLTVAKSRIGRISDQVSFAALSAKEKPTTASYLKHISAAAPDFVKRIHHLMQKATTLPPHELVCYVIKHMHLLESYGDKTVQTSSEAHLSELNLLALPGRALQAEAAGMNTLFEVCRYFEKLATLDEVGNASTASDVIHLMTIHKSKGLEFPLVILADSARAFAKDEAYWTQRRIPKPERREDRVIYCGTAKERPVDPKWEINQALEAARERTRAESHRLLYVALTRAQHYLVVTGHEPTTHAGGLEGTSYHSHIREVFEGMLARPVSNSSRNTEPVTVEGFTFLAARSSVAPSLSKTETKDTSEAEVSTPLPYLPPSELGLKTELALVNPSQTGGAKGHSLGGGGILASEIPHGYASTVGSLIHRGLECHLSALSFAFDQEWHSAGLPEEEWKEDVKVLLAAALENPTLTSLVQARPDKEVLSEFPLAYLKEGMLLRGIADLIIDEEGVATVVDYKTARFALSGAKPSASELKGIQAFVDERGYRSQLQFYKDGLKAMYPEKEVRGLIWFIPNDVWITV